MENYGFGYYEADDYDVHYNPIPFYDDDYLSDDVEDDDYYYDVWSNHGDLHVEDHEMFLFEFNPELDDENQDLFQLLKLAEMTRKLINALKLRRGRVRREDLELFRSIEVEDFLELLPSEDVGALLAVLVEKLMGGEEKLEDLYKDSMQVKIFAMRSLRGHLAEVMPISLDDHILDNILGHINSEEGKFVRSSEEEKSDLAEMYRYLSRIYCEISCNLFTEDRTGVYSVSECYYSLFLNDLHELVDRVYREHLETTGDQEQESGKDAEGT